MYDVIVVGGRCAGAPLATLLARRGYRVLMADRDAADHGGRYAQYIQPGGVDRMNRLRFGPALRATGAPDIRNVRLQVGGEVYEGSPPAVGGAGAACAPRRFLLDRSLVREAARAGVDVREGLVVDEVLFDASRAVGVRGRETGAHGRFSARAQIVVGADGRWSTVARAVRAPIYLEAPSLTWTCTALWSGLPIDGLEIIAHDRRVAAVFPTDGGLTAVAVSMPARGVDMPADAVDAYSTAIQDLVGIRDRAPRAQIESALTGSANLPGYFRRPFGPGWMLVGDAGYHRDPITALGIADAFRDAEDAAEAIHEGLSGARPLYSALADYHARRDSEVLRSYEATLLLASLDDMSRMRTLLGTWCDSVGCDAPVRLATALAAGHRSGFPA